MAITWQNVINVAPKAAQLPTAAQNEILGIVANQVDPETWDVRADDGSKYLAAHLATLWLMKGSGALTGETLGAMSRQYAMPNWLQNSLGLTSYGAEYQRMLRLLDVCTLGIVGS